MWGIYVSSGRNWSCSFANTFELHYILLFKKKKKKDSDFHKRDVNFLVLGRVFLMLFNPSLGSCTRSLYCPFTPPLTDSSLSSICCWRMSDSSGSVKWCVSDGLPASPPVLTYMWLHIKAWAQGRIKRSQALGTMLEPPPKKKRCVRKWTPLLTVHYK